MVVAQRDSEAGGGAWVKDDLSNSRMLVPWGEHVCSTTLTQVLYCLDAATGEDVFRLQLDEEEMAGSPVLVGDQLVVAGSRLMRGAVRAYSPAGDELWQAPVDVPADSPVAAVGGVVVAIDRDELVALDAATGDERWSAFAPSESDDTAPEGGVFTDGTRLFTALTVVDGETLDITGAIVAVDPASGAELWRSGPYDINTSVGIASAVPFDDGSAVAFYLHGGQDSPGRVVVLDPTTGATLWEVVLVDIYGSVAHVGGTTVVADGPDTRAYDAAGNELWRIGSPVIEHDPDMSSPDELVVTGGRLFVAGSDVFEIDPRDGRSTLIRDGVNASDVEIVGDQLIVAGIHELEAIPLVDVSAAGAGAGT